MIETRTVHGKLVDESGNGVPNVFVWRFLGETPYAPTAMGEPLITGTSGSFTLTFKYIGPVHRLLVRFTDFVGRIVAKQIVLETKDWSDGDLGEVLVNSKDMNGWLVTELTGSPVRLTLGNTVTLLVDNALAFKDLAESIEGAKVSIDMSQLLIDFGRLFLTFNPDPPLIGTFTKGKRIEHLLVDAAESSGRAVPVRLLLERNDSVLIVTGSFLDNGIRHLIRFTDPGKDAQIFFDPARGVKPNKVQIKLFPRNVMCPLHAKMVVVDNTICYQMGSPGLQEYYNDSSHAIWDLHRGGYEWYNALRTPVHDVSVKLAGPCVSHVAETFSLCWDRKATPSKPPDASGPTAVQIIRNLPPETFPDIPKGEVGILEAYQRAFRNARDFIYCENQYFTEPEIAKSLLQALEKNQKLEVIFLINNALDVPLYNRSQTSLITGLKEHLPKINAQDRVGFFTLWSTAAPLTAGAPVQIIRTYVHSKAAVVDDAWATIGSANLDGASLTFLKELVLSFGPQHPDQLRSIEVNAVFYNNVDGTPPSEIPGLLRRTLWAEHLGYSNINHSDLRTPPADGWVGLWKRVAQQKIGPNGVPRIDGGRILPWLPETSTRKFLKKSNINGVAAFEQGPQFHHSVGQWLQLPK